MGATESDTPWEVGLIYRLLMHLPKITKIVHKGRSGGAVRAGIGSIGICSSNISIGISIFISICIFIGISSIGICMCIGIGSINICIIGIGISISYSIGIVMDPFLQSFYCLELSGTGRQTGTQTDGQTCVLGG